MRKQRVLSLHRQHGPEKQKKVFIRYRKDRRGTLRDMDSPATTRTRASIEKEFGPITGCDIHIQTVGLAHWAEVLRLYSLKIVSYPIPSYTPGRSPVLHDGGGAAGVFNCTEHV
ncbi:MAG: hypothetical protein QF879_13580 [Candidatus Latescibacteria bacterium]|jgi:hypothetical protein|nr:hypothetical protein [Candidatus Latescibacterota bacterium]